MRKMIAFYHDKDIDMLKLGCFLPNLANICLHKSTDVKFYPFTEGDKDFFGKNQRRCCWWSLYHFYTQSSCWWNFYPKVCKHMQIYWWDWCQPTKSLLDVSTHANRSLYALQFRFRNKQIHTSTKQDPQLWKYGHVLFPTSKTRMWNWKLLYNRQTEENWLLQCWWALLSLQHCVWSPRLLLPLLPLSRTASLSHWIGYSTWEQEESARCIEATLYTRERLHGYWNVGVRMVNTVQNNQYC